jgi:hypothetical protein
MMIYVCIMDKRVEKGFAPVPFEKVDVECHSGYRANERPLAFFFQGRRWEIAEIVDRWYEGDIKAGSPSADYFKVRTIEGKVFLLRYLSLFDAWSVYRGMMSS